MRALAPACLLLFVSACFVSGGGNSGGVTPTPDPDGDGPTPLPTEDPTDAPRECEAPRQLCAGVCVDTRSDPGHCNACNRSCAEGEVCEDGRCEVGGDCTQSPCTGFSYCDLTIGRCVRGCISDDACPAAERCDPELRDCVCLAGTHRCDGICVSDDAVTSCGDRCEACPTVAGAVARCSGGQCDFECDAGLLRCGQVCAQCPQEGATDFACDGERCIVSDCAPGHALCDGDCAVCPTESAIVSVGCSADRCVATACEAGHRLCDERCSPCPDNALTLGCEGERCVATSCDEELELCDGHCARCPEDSAVLGLQCDGQRCEATECDFTRVRVCAAGCCSWTGDPVSSGGAGLRSGDFFRGDSDADGGVYFLDFNDREASGEDDYSVGYFGPGASRATTIARIGRHPGRSAADVAGAGAHLHATWLGLNDAGEQRVFYAHAPVSGSNFESRLSTSFETPFGSDIGRPSVAALPGAEKAVLCLDEAGCLETGGDGDWRELALPRPAISNGATLRILDLDGDSAGNVHALFERAQGGNATVHYTWRNADGSSGNEVVPGLSRPAGSDEGMDLAALAGGPVHLCHVASDQARVWTFHDGTWAQDVVGGTGENVGLRDCSVAVDRSGRPHVATSFRPRHRDEFLHIAYGYRRSDGWVFEPIDNLGPNTRPLLFLGHREEPRTLCRRDGTRPRLWFVFGDPRE